MVVVVVVVVVVVAVVVAVVVVVVVVVVIVVFIVPHTTFSMLVATNWCPRATFYWLCARKLPLVLCCYKLAVFLYHGGIFLVAQGRQFFW